MLMAAHRLLLTAPPSLVSQPRGGGRARKVASCTRSHSPHPAPASPPRTLHSLFLHPLSLSCLCGAQWRVAARGLHLTSV